MSAATACNEHDEVALIGLEVNSREMLERGDDVAVLRAIVRDVEADAQVGVDHEPDWDTNDPVPPAEEKKPGEVKALDRPRRSSQAGGLVDAQYSGFSSLCCGMNVQDAERGHLPRQLRQINWPYKVADRPLHAC